MTNRILAFLAILLATALPASAFAASVNYTFNGVFDQGLATGTYSGNFTYDTVSQTVTSASVSVSAGNDEGGFPRAANTYSAVTGSASTYFVVSNTPAANGDRGFAVQLLTNNLESPTPAVSMAYDTDCAVDGCGGIRAAGNGVSASASASLMVASVPAAVPTLSEWAMILFASVLAGGAALYIQRRRHFV